MTQLTTTPATPAQTDFLSRPLLATLNLDLEKTIYLVFILVAIVSRFWGLGDRVMSHDESLHTQFSYQYYDGQGYQHTPLMHGPSLFHITAAAYWLFGDSDLSARIPVAVVGIILVLLPYWLRPWIGRIGALFASFLLLISPYITYYSRYIRHDIYIIVAAFILFISIWYYLRQPKDKYLWWFAVGLALMFTTMETSFIYVAIFGSFLVVRLLAQMVGEGSWFRRVLPRLGGVALLLLAAILLIGIGFVGQRLAVEEATTATTTEATEGFAVDPEQEPAAPATTQTGGSETLLRWLTIAGIGLLSLGLFLAARQMRPHLDNYPEFDLIILFTTLVLPAASPLLTKLAGWNARDYTLNTCILQGQESMTALQLFLARLGNSTCVVEFMRSGMVRSGSFLILALVVSVLVGLWWNRHRWIVAAAIFHGIFILLFTSLFTNPGGWASGMIGSLGYWLDQHDVQRGNQPGYYYFFVTTFYEFLPIIFSLVAIRFWLARHRLNKVVGYWLTTILLSLLVYSLTRWLYLRSTGLQPLPPSPQGIWPVDLLVGLGAGLFVFLVAILYWFFVRQRQLVSDEQMPHGWRELLRIEPLLEFIPFLVWWWVLTWIAYSLAGEKMPWLSSHFLTPMVLMVGWYFNEKLKDIQLQRLWSRPAALLLGLTMLLIVTALLALGPILLGQIQFGDQQASNLYGLGRFLGGLLVAGILLYFWEQVYLTVDKTVRGPVIILSIFALLSLLTIRFTYMAAFRNADYTTEFMVYAHGAPATKAIVLDQVEELSLRLHGDNSIRVAYDNDVSWPYTWYLRNYPNRVYFGENPSQSLNESPIIIVGRQNWEKVEPFLGSNYDSSTYTFLWWPMEDYRRFSWNAIFGDSTMPVRRGLGNPHVRQALWDIFFYRDYQKYGEVFGNSYTASEWPLRHELRLYIRKDVLAKLWDRGLGAVNAEGLQDPYEENALALSPVGVWNEAGIAGAGLEQFSAPRNVALGPDGRLYIADTGNHRLQVFDTNGRFVTAWGSLGSEPGQFNEPWGVVVDDQFVYVADTWNHRIQKFGLDGELVAVFGRSGAPGDEPDTGGLGLFFGPRDLLLLPDNRLLVTDTGNHRLQILTRDGQFISVIGGFGNLLGQFNEPVGLAAAPDGSIYLADTWNGRIQYFSPDLTPLGEWHVDAWKSQSINNKPYLAIDSAGRVYTTDPEGYRVIIFSPTGDYLGRFGQFGPDVNSFGLPNGIAIDAADNIYVADATNNRVLKFEPVFGPSVIEAPAEEDGAEDGAQDPALEENDPEAADELDTSAEEDVIEAEASPVDSESDELFPEGGASPTATSGSQE